MLEEGPSAHLERGVQGEHHCCQGQLEGHLAAVLAEGVEAGLGLWQGWCQGRVVVPVSCDSSCELLSAWDLQLACEAVDVCRPR